MKLNTNIYNVKTVYNEGTEGEFWTSDPIHSLSNDNFDESLLICRQADDSPWSKLTDISSYNEETKTADIMPCNFGVFPFKGISYKSSSCNSFVPDSYYDTGEIITKYDYKKLVFTVQTWIEYRSGNEYYNATINNLINDGDPMDYDRFVSLNKISIRALYNNEVINSNGYGGSVGGLCKSDKYNFCDSANSLFAYPSDYLSRVDLGGGVCLDSPPIVVNDNGNVYDARFDLRGMKKSEVIDLIRSLVARLGFLFTDGGSGVFGDHEVYLPEIKDGVSTGKYFRTDDLENVDSDNIDWSDRLEIDTKTPEQGDEDDTEKMTIGGFYSVGGLVNYYSLVNTPEHNPLNEISENLSNWDYVETGKDVLKNLVSLKAIPISRDSLCRGTAKHVVIAGTDTGVNGQSIDSVYDRIILGSVSIPRRYNDFRDYAPFTKIEVCAPFVGWMQIPSHAMGRNIRLEMTYDIVSGSCKVYVILDDNTIITEACGNIAMDIPFTADAVGVKAANMINAGLGVAGSALSLGSGLISGNIVGSASGIIGMANSITQTICSSNANYTEVRGNTGDANNFYGVKQCYLKVTYPISHIPDNYAKTVGYLYNNTTTLSEGMGFTKTANTYISGNMLESEKQEIINLMENGVIL